MEQYKQKALDDATRFAKTCGDAALRNAKEMTGWGDRPINWNGSRADAAVAMTTLAAALTPIIAERYSALLAKEAETPQDDPELASLLSGDATTTA